jgi:hypothetical protein
LAGKVLDAVTPAWKKVAGGCHLNQDPSKKLKELGFEEESFEILWTGLGKMWHLRKPLLQKMS